MKTDPEIEALVPLAELTFVRQPTFPIDYKGLQIGEHRADLIVANSTKQDQERLCFRRPSGQTRPATPVAGATS